MTSGAPLRGIVAGLGVMGSHHLRVLSSLAGVRVVAVAEPDQERRQAAGARYPQIAVHADLAEALAQHHADFVCVAVPIGDLPRTTLTALEAGAHVLVEKPTAPSEAQALEMIRAAAARGLGLGVGHIERHNPAVIALKERLERGEVGRVLQLHARRLSPFPARTSMRGVALDLATHDIDVMRFLTGAEVDRVFAESSAPLGGPAEDMLCATLRFGSGATGLLETNWVTPTKVRQLTVTGEHGMFVLDYLTQDLSFYEHPTTQTDWDTLAGMRAGQEGDMIRYALRRREPLVQEWESFLGALRAGQAPPVSGADGYAALSIATAIQRSASEHQALCPAYRSPADVEPGR